MVGIRNGIRKSPYISSPKKSLNLLVLTGSGNSAPESETQVGSAGCRGARRNRDVGRPDSKRDHLAACTPHSVDTPFIRHTRRRVVIECIVFERIESVESEVDSMDE